MSKSLLSGLFLTGFGCAFSLGLPAQPKAAPRQIASSATVSQLKSDRMDVKVLSSQRLGHKGAVLQICEDANGRLFKRINGVANQKVSAQIRAPRMAELAEGVALAESFEAFDGTETWLPEGWTSKKTEGLDEYYHSWFITAQGMYTPAPSDGSYLAEIIYASKAQDEWLITPEITVPAGGVLSFYNYIDPIFLFNLDSENVDWDNMVFINKIVSATLQIMVSVDGGEWKLLKDWTDDYMDMSLTDLYGESPTTMDMKKSTLNLAAYEGKNVRIGFRYVGIDGNSMFIDQIQVGMPELECAYANPTGTLFYGLNQEFGAMPYSILMEPVYTPLTWLNTTYNEAATYSWQYHDPVTNDMQTKDGEELTLTYKPDYTNEFTTRNNLFYLPTLTISAPHAADGTYKAPYDYMQMGGRAEWLFEGDEEPTRFGLMTCDILTEGMTIMTVDTEDPMEASTPIFGYNKNSTAWWTDHYFQGDQADDEKAEVTGVINIFQAPESPMAIDGLWLNAKGQIGDNATLTAAIYPLTDEGLIAEEPIAEATCNGSDIIVEEGGIQNYLTIPFTFDKPATVSNKDYSLYIVKISGFNTGDVTYFAPMQSMLPNPDGMCYGWIEVTITSGIERTTLVPIANFEGDAGECYNSFFVNLSATYPWLVGEDDTFEASENGESHTFTADCYYPAEELTFTANTADGKLPNWLTASAAGRYGNTTITFSATPNKGEAHTCDIAVSAPGVSKIYHISQKAGQTDGICSAPTTSASPVVGIYNLSGQRVSGTHHGASIVKQADGTVKKVIR